jgi:DNA-binding MarR family transcriptional regulator
MAAKTEDILEAWGAFFVAHALAIRQIGDNLKGRAPLSLDEYDVLLGISRAPGGKIRFSDLAAATVFTRSGITRVASRLEERGLLERAECPEDRRGAIATLTPKGRETMKRTWELYSREILTLLEPCFDRNEAREFKSMLERIISSARKEPLVQIGKVSAAPVERRK